MAMKEAPSTSAEVETPQAESEDVSEYNYNPEPVERLNKPLNTSPGAVKLRTWLNKSFRIEMTDGRVLIGVFLCTDRDANIILGSCSEYLPHSINGKPANEEPRMLGLVMIPGKHIVPDCVYHPQT
ncbi:unnamed protein product [Acanthoscelides obtectus]|uniref:Sm domain-containing protein n=1 Tax=Acanthoscelides obtectus TaxID=200917 RepID=A0A9P0MEW6_ACAOB|nr:unnamed protein product [Acanthoscelides obtectus]CAK1672135.1 N-alpha-acetyltransferase 38, NatC auxiliary subunit [Acanthoscelides obtectus]